MLFCLRLSGLVTNIRTLGETVEESYVVKKMLRAVPARFLQIVSAIEQFGKLEEMSVEEIVGSLKAHEERMHGQIEKAPGQLMMTEEEWVKREASEGKKLLLRKEEWLKRSSKGGTESSHSRNTSTGGFQGGRGGHYKGRVRCFNCYGYGHYAAECRKPKREKDSRPEANLTQVQDDEPALLFTKADESKDKMLLFS